MLQITVYKSIQLQPEQWCSVSEICEGPYAGKTDLIIRKAETRAQRETETKQNRL